MAANFKITYNVYNGNTKVYIYQDNEWVGSWAVYHSGDDAIDWENKDGVVDDESVSRWAKSIAEEIGDEFNLDEESKQEIIDKFESILDDFRTD